LQSAVAFAFAVAIALALLVVIPEGDLLLLSPLPVLLPNQKLCHPALSVVEWVLIAFVSNVVERSGVVLAGCLYLPLLLPAVILSTAQDPEELHKPKPFVPFNPYLSAEKSASLSKSKPSQNAYSLFPILYSLP
jgi:hypothetical protein